MSDLEEDLEANWRMFCGFPQGTVYLVLGSPPDGLEVWAAKALRYSNRNGRFVYQLDRKVWVGIRGPDRSQSQWVHRKPEQTFVTIEAALTEVNRLRAESIATVEANIHSLRISIQNFEAEIRRLEERKAVLASPVTIEEGALSLDD